MRASSCELAIQILGHPNMRKGLHLLFTDTDELPKRRERQSLIVGNLPEDVVEAIEAAKYGAEPE
jgi:hypothetical protein